MYLINQASALIGGSKNIEQMARKYKETSLIFQGKSQGTFSGSFSTMHLNGAKIPLYTYAKAIPFKIRFTRLIFFTPE
jgi:hypothetical protein